MEQGMGLPDDMNLELEEGMPDDEDGVVEMIMESDLQIGEALKESIIPFAVRWYTGEAAPDDDDDDEDSEEEEDDEESEDEDDDDDDDEPPKKGGKAKAKAKGKAG